MAEIPVTRQAALDRRDLMKGLGLTKLNKTVELKNTEAIRGMIRKVIYLVEVG